MGNTEDLRALERLRELDRLRELERLIEIITHLQNERDEARRWARKLYVENEKLTDALLFYASPETYFAISLIVDRPAGDFVDDISVVDDDWGERPGKLARETLDDLGRKIDFMPRYG